MAQIALSIGGSILGNALLPGVGEVIGGVLGSAAGGVIDSLWLGSSGSKPRTDDTRVQFSTYGRPINRIFGTQRIAGEVIWAFPLIKVKHNTSIGGKGLAPSAVSYTYKANFAVGLCEGPIAGILRIWGDSKLLADFRPGYYGPQPLRAAAIRVYNGTENQLPDPLITAYQGSHAPAFRGLAYIVFQDLKLDDFANRIPNITVEVVTDAASAWPFTSVEVNQRSAADVEFDPDTGFIYTARGDGPFLKFSTQSNALLASSDPSINASYGMCLGVDGYLYASRASSNWGPLQQIDPDTLAIVQLFGEDGIFSSADTWPLFGTIRSGFAQSGTFDPLVFINGAIGNPGDVLVFGAMFIDSPAQIAIGNITQGAWYGNTGALVSSEVDALAAAGITKSIGDTLTYQTAAMDPQGNIWGLVANSPSGNCFLVRLVPLGNAFDNAGGDPYGLQIAEAVDLTAFFSPSVTSATQAQMALIPGTSQFLVAWGGYAIKYDIEARALTSPSGSQLSLGISWASEDVFRIGPQQNYMVFNDNTTILLVDVAGWSVTEILMANFSDAPISSEMFWNALTQSAWTIDNIDLNTFFTQLFLTRITPAAVPLSTIVEDLCCDVGLWGRPIGVTMESASGTLVTMGLNEAPPAGQSLEVGDQVTTAGFADSRLNGTWTITAVTPTTFTFDSGISGLGGDAGQVGTVQPSAGVDIDASSLESTGVNGYVISRMSPARAALEQLQTVFFFDAVESDNLLKFVKRGAAAALALSSDQVGATDKEGEFAEPVEFKLGAVDDLPWETDLTFTNPDAIYQQGCQRYRRNEQLVPTANRQSVDTPVCFTNDQARAVVETLMFIAWVSRASFKFACAIALLLLDPTDVITLPVGADTYSVRLTRAAAGANLLLQFEGMLEDAEIYNPSPASGGGPGPGAAPPPPPIVIYGPARLFLIDVNALRDSEANQTDGGFYLAAGAIDPNLAYAGTAIYRSIDGGADFSVFDTDTDQVTWGSATDALAAPRAWTVWDRVNSLTVRLASSGPALTAAGNDLAVLNGANAALLGNEVIQFRDVTENADGTYTLSTLLRGRRGTEWAVGTHQAGDIFILLTIPEIHNETDSTGNLDLLRYYKAASIGSDILPSISTKFANTGNRLKPYAGMYPTGTRDMSGNLTIDWTRRTRQGGDASWRDYIIEVPLSEASESYQVDIIKSGAAVRTLTASSPSAAYSAADQTTDFGSPQSAIEVNIYQMSEVIGRGYPLEATV